MHGDEAIGAVHERIGSARSDGRSRRRSERLVRKLGPEAGQGL